VNILAIDTSCATAGVCIALIDDEGARALASAEAQDNRAEALAPMVKRAIEEAKLEMAALARIAVTVGPGSFTGIRIGLSLGKAMGLALDIPVVGVSTLEAFAGAFLGQPGGPIAAVVDAKHGAVYFQLFDARGGSLVAPRALKTADAVRAIGSGPVRIAGDAAETLAEDARRAGLAVDAVAQGAAPNTLTVAKLAAKLDPKTAPARPLYVKAPDVTVKGAA
jgi:tRNA threonylcarbamoyl adenosine modification protein YeaZ